MIRRAVTVLLVVVAVTSAGAEQQKKQEIPLRPIRPLDLARTLDLYASGQFDEAVQAVARAGDEIGRNLRRHWAVTGRAWIDAVPERRARRLLAAAALALETENVRAERGDWRASENPLCAAACVLDWAHLQLLERGEPDEAERAWYLAAASLAGGVRDWRYLQRTIDPARAPRTLPGLMDRALLRFPGDAALRLEQALAAAGRYNVLPDDSILGGSTAVDSPARLRRLMLPMRGTLDPGPAAAADFLAALRDDPAVGAEARLRLGYLFWANHDSEAAGAELRAAAQATDRNLRYLAHFLLGWTTLARDRVSALASFRAALEARPESQSAAVALAALELQSGDASSADEAARAALQGRADVDPWRLFLYGHHPQLRARIASLRREVSR